MLRHKPQDVRVLVVDDNITNQEVVMSVLLRLGYSSHVVGGAQEALAAMEAKAYDVVLMDCQMPGMDGFEATRHLRSPASRAKNPKAYIVAMTASAIKGDLEKCQEAGMDDYLHKPISTCLLIEAIERAMDGGVKKRSFIGSTEPQGRVVFDQIGFEGRVGDRETAYLIAKHFIEDFPNRMVAMQDAIVKKEAATIQRLAHGVKGTAANLGALALSSVAAEMEKACMGGDHLRGVAFLPKLVWEFERFKQIATACLGPE